MHTMLSLTTEEFGTTITTADTQAFLSSVLEGRHAERFGRLVESCRIERRQALGSYDRLRQLGTLEERNALYMKHALPTGERAARTALGRAGVEARDVDILIVASSTGYSVPTLDHHLASCLGLRPDARSLFLGGLGCAGAVRAIGLAGDFLNATSASTALVVSVELCSPWLQVAEPSPEDILSNVMFGDGAAAMVIGRRDGAGGPRVVASHTELWPQSLGARAATLTQSGFRHFASPTLPRLVRAHLRRTVETFVSRQGFSPRDLRFYAINPSDHRVLDAVASTLGVPEPLMQPAWTAWQQHGNTLSAGPLYVMDALRRIAPPADGDLGLAVVIGPGITCDLTLLRWHAGLSS